METASLRTVSNALKMTSQLSFGKEVLLILTLNCVSSCSSQSDASKGDASTIAWIALAVALPCVEEPSTDVVVAKLRRPLLAVSVGMNGGGIELVEWGRYGLDAPSTPTSATSSVTALSR
jgi:hypothetical protein